MLQETSFLFQFAFVVSCFTAFHTNNGLFSVLVHVLVTNVFFPYCLDLRIGGGALYMFAIFCGSMCGFAIHQSRKNQRLQLEHVAIAICFWGMAFVGTMLWTHLLMFFLFLSDHSTFDFMLFDAIHIISFAAIPFAFTVTVRHVHILVLLTLAWCLFCQIILPRLYAPPRDTATSAPPTDSPGNSPQTADVDLASKRE